MLKREREREREREGEWGAESNGKLPYLSSRTAALVPEFAGTLMIFHDTSD